MRFVKQPYRERMERRWKVLMVAAVAVFIGFLDVTIVNVAFPDIQSEFPGAARADLSWVLNAYDVVFAAVLVPSGRLADIVGRKRMFMIGLLVFLAASAACGVAGSVETLVAARVLQAVGGAILVRWVFFVNIPIGLAAVVPARRILREHREPGALPDALGAVGLVAGVGLLAPSLFRSRSFSVAVAGTFAFSFAFYALILGNVLFLTQVWGWSILTAGFAITPGPLMATISAPIGGRLSDRFGQRPVALPGALLFAAGSAWFALRLGTSPHYASDYLVGTLLTGSGVGLSYAAWASAAVAELPADRFASGSAVLACLRQVGAVLGIAVLVAVLEGASPADPLGAFSSAYAVIAGAALVAGVLALALGRVRATALATAVPEPA